MESNPDVNDTPWPVDLHLVDDSLSEITNHVSRFEKMNDSDIAKALENMTPEATRKKAEWTARVFRDWHKWKNDQNILSDTELSVFDDINEMKHDWKISSVAILLIAHSTFQLLIESEPKSLHVDAVNAFLLYEYIYSKFCNFKFVICEQISKLR